MDLIKKLSSQIVTDLQELEGDFRAANLPLDKAQSAVYMFIAAVSILAMFVVDMILFAGDTRMLWAAGLMRLGYALATGVAIAIVLRLNRVRAYDRLTFVWLVFTLLFLLTFDLYYPSQHPTTVFDIITIFALYVLSPLPHRTNFLLAATFTLGTLLITFFARANVDTATVLVVVSGQLVVHTLGVGAALQLQSYRRKSYKAFIEERDAREMVAYLANIDPLTKSLTRRHFFNIAESEFRRFERYRRPFSVLVVDADSFKQVNDTYGHHAGDIVLRSLSLVAMEQKRVQDTFGRLGGEEFGLILPETSLEQARVVAERIRAVWEQTPSTMDGRLIHSTVSIGVAEAIEGDKAFDVVLRRADLMMYKAKERGRNQVAWE